MPKTDLIKRGIRSRRAAAISGFLAVSLGAFGAHALRDLLARNGSADVWDTAVLYHFIHTIMLFVLADQTGIRRVAFLSFLVGILVFSGSLYLLAVTGISLLGAVTPLGGVAFLVGWASLIRGGFPDGSDPSGR